MPAPTAMVGRSCRVAVAVLVVLLLVTGCGRLSKKEFIHKGDAICRGTNAEAAKVPVPNKTDVLGTAQYLRTTSKLLMAQDDKIQALKAPKQDQPRLTDVFARQRDALTQLQSAANQYQLGDPATAQATASTANSALLEVRQDLQGYGFSDCASQ